MKLVGLTGGIGSGKSFIAEIFRELGIAVYNADERARVISDNNPDVKAKVISKFGQKAYQENKLDRLFIAGIVFDNPVLLDDLNRIIHPAVEEDFITWCKSQKEHKYVLKEAAILFETGSYKSLDSTILVVAPEDRRIKRVQKRDNIDSDNIKKRIARQWEDQKKRKLADYIINNDGNTLVLPQIIQIHNKLSDND